MQELFFEIISKKFNFEQKCPIEFMIWYLVEEQIFQKSFNRAEGHLRGLGLTASQSFSKRENTLTTFYLFLLKNIEFMYKIDAC